MNLRFWDNWNEKDRTSAARVLGLLVSAFTIFIFVSTLSYLFHWQEDMSLLSPGAAGSAANKAGTLGNKTGFLLVGECFGLGSFSLLIILIALSIKLLAGKSGMSLIKLTLISLSGALIFAIAFAYIGFILNTPNAFWGGLGGHCGAFIVNWSNGLMGEIVTGILAGVFVISWIILSSIRIPKWVFNTIGKIEEHITRRKEERKEKAELRKAEEEAAKEAAENASVDAAEGENIEEKDTEDTTVQEAVEITQDINGIDIAGQAEPGELFGAEPFDPVELGFEVEPENGIEIIRDDDGLSTEITEPLEPIDNRLDPPYGLPNFKMPSLELLQNYKSARHDVTTEELTRNNNKIRAALSNYRINVDDVKAIVGPTVTLYKVYPSAGVKISDIKKLQEDIAMSLNAKGVRVVTLSDSVGIEVANDYSSIVPLKALLNDSGFRESKADLPVAIGYTITQEVKVFDLADAPHLLIAGATKQGKSVGLNVIVSSLLYSKHPSELKFVFIDPKMVEFTAYSQLLKHYLAVLPEAASEKDEKDNAIVKLPKDAEKILRSLCIEMDDRYTLLSKAGVNNIKLYNNKFKERHLNPEHGHRFLPYLVVVVDEYADLTMTAGASADSKAAGRSITSSIIRLAQKGRAAGIHVILATQRPSVDVISGLIKSNFPMRIAFRVASRVDSMTILDSPGAEKLIGKGDMLFSAGIDSERIQCGYVSGDETEALTGAIGKQTGYGKCYNTPYYLPLPSEAGSSEGGSLDVNDMDERFEEAARLIVTNQKGSTSDLQRRLGMGYAKAGRVMDQLEAAGIVGPQEGSKPRQVLVSDLDSLQTILDNYKR